MYNSWLYCIDVYCEQRSLTSGDESLCTNISSPTLLLIWSKPACAWNTSIEASMLSKQVLNKYTLALVQAYARMICWQPHTALFEWSVIQGLRTCGRACDTVCVAHCGTWSVFVWTPQTTGLLGYLNVESLMSNEAPSHSSKQVLTLIVRCWGVLEVQWTTNCHP